MRTLSAILLVLVATAATAQPHWGNHPDGGMLHFYTNTIGSDGAGETPVAEDVMVYRDAGVDGELLTTGVTIDDDYESDQSGTDAKTGLHRIAINTDATGFEAGYLYTVVYSAGTSDGVSLTGRVIGTFTLGPVAANVTHFSGSASAADNAKIVYDTDFAANYDATNYLWKTNLFRVKGSDATDYVETRTLAAADYFDPTADTVTNVTTTGTATNLTNLPSIPSEWITAAGIADGAIHVTAMDAGAIRADVFQPGAIDSTAIAADAITAAKLHADASAEIADSVLLESVADHQASVGSLAAYVDDVFSFLDGAPTFAQAMVDHEYTSARAIKLDNLNNLDMPVSQIWTQSPSLLVTTTIETLTDQSHFTLTAGPPDDRAIEGALVVVTNDDGPAGAKKAVGLVKHYDGSTRRVTLAADPDIFDMAEGDQVDVIVSGFAVAASQDGTGP